MRLLQICDAHISIKVFVFAFKVLLMCGRNRIFCKILFAITHVDSEMIKDQVHIKRSKHIKWLERIVHCVICIMMCDMSETSVSQ